MSTVAEIETPKQKQRLMFIDMARSIAILLMLEGHFIGCTLADQAHYHNTNNMIFNAWNFVRGFTAPMFFTVTGLVFVYLLTSSKEEGFLKNIRVRKGFRRSFQLIFWGYFLQINLIHIKSYFTDEISDWVFAFHVLQSIGFGISFLLLIYGLHKLIKRGTLPLYYFIAGTLLFAFYPQMKHKEENLVLIDKIEAFHSKASNTITLTEYNDIQYLLYQMNKEELKEYHLVEVKDFFEYTKNASIQQIQNLHSFHKDIFKLDEDVKKESYTYFPKNAPQIIQNLFRGPYSVFPIVPWLAFTFYGAMVGAIINRYKEHVKKNWFPLVFIGLGLGLNLFGWTIFKNLDILFKTIHFHDDLDFVKNAWLYGRVGQILIVLGILMFIEKYFQIKNNLFIKVGQNTLPIYIIHVILLYGGVFGIGIKDFYAEKLNPYQAIAGAAMFITTFVIMIKYWEIIEGTWATFKNKALVLLRIRNKE